MKRRSVLGPSCSKDNKFIMTPSQQIKSAGLSSLNEVAEITKQSPQTLSNWAKNKPELFKVVIAGCLALKEAS